MNTEDNAIAGQVRQGSAASARPVKFSDPERWVEEHGDYLFKYALWRLRDPTKAEDMIQDLLKPVARGITFLSLGCREASRLQSQALDRKLPLVQRIGLRMHLLLCKWCRRYRQQIRFLRDAALQHPDRLSAPVRRNLSQSARDRIQQRLQAEQE